jgi:hypothetical protein
VNLLFHFAIPEIGHGLIAIVALAIVSGGLLSAGIMAMFIAKALKKQLLRLGRAAVTTRPTLSVSSPVSAR